MDFHDPPNVEIVEQFRQIEHETERRIVAVHKISPKMNHQPRKWRPIDYEIRIWFTECFDCLKDAKGAGQGVEQLSTITDSLELFVF